MGWYTEDGTSGTYFQHRAKNGTANSTTNERGTDGKKKDYTEGDSDFDEKMKAIKHSDDELQHNDFKKTHFGRKYFTKKKG